METVPTIVAIVAVCLGASALAGLLGWFVARVQGLGWRGAIIGERRAKIIDNRRRARIAEVERVRGLCREYDEEEARASQAETGVLTPRGFRISNQDRMAHGMGRDTPMTYGIDMARPDADDTVVSRSITSMAQSAQTARASSEVSNTFADVANDVLAMLNEHNAVRPVATNPEDVMTRTYMGRPLDHLEEVAVWLEGPKICRLEWIENPEEEDSDIPDLVAVSGSPWCMYRIYFNPANNTYNLDVADGTTVEPFEYLFQAQERANDIHATSVISFLDMPKLD